MPLRSTELVDLNPEDVPEGQRSWVSTALIIPLNRVLAGFRQLLNRGISLRAHVNAQVVERKFTAPSGSDWSAERLDVGLTISGPVLGVQVLACYSLDASGNDAGPVGALPSPTWKEIVQNGGKSLRLVYQSGLTGGSRYRLVLLVWGQ